MRRIAEDLLRRLLIEQMLDLIPRLIDWLNSLPWQAWLIWLGC